jgi:hypothetical protein
MSSVQYVRSYRTQCSVGLSQVASDHIVLTITYVLEKFNKTVMSILLTTNPHHCHLTHNNIFIVKNIKLLHVAGLNGSTSGSRLTL